MIPNSIRFRIAAHRGSFLGKGLSESPDRFLQDLDSSGGAMDRARRIKRGTENNNTTGLKLGRKDARPVLYIHCNTMRQRSEYGGNRLPSIIRGRWLLRGCPKCSGDLYYNIEPDGEYMHCLQCGYDSNEML